MENPNDDRAPAYAGTGSPLVRMERKNNVQNAEESPAARGGERGSLTRSSQLPALGAWGRSRSFRSRDGSATQAPP